MTARYKINGAMVLLLDDNHCREDFLSNIVEDSSFETFVRMNPCKVYAFKAYWATLSTHSELYYVLEIIQAKCLVLISMRDYQKYNFNQRVSAMKQYGYKPVTDIVKNVVMLHIHHKVYCIKLTNRGKCTLLKKLLDKLDDN